VRCGTVATVLHCFIWYFGIFVGAATPITHNMAPPLNRGVHGPSCWRCDGSVSSTREKYTQQSRPRADNKNDQGVAPWLATRTRAATDRWPEETPRALVFALENQGFLVPPCGTPACCHLKTVSVDRSRCRTQRHPLEASALKRFLPIIISHENET
jgi:hypothetical protein